VAPKTCAAASRLLKSIQMQPLRNRNVRWFRPAIASLMSGIMVLLAVSAASGALHLKLHTDGSSSQHGTCAICSFAHGQVETLVAVTPEVFAPLSVSWTLSVLQSLPLANVDRSVAFCRGPPASGSSL